MKRVQKGISMVAKTATRIEEGLDFQKNVLVELSKEGGKGDQGKYLLPNGQRGTM